MRIEFVAKDETVHQTSAVAVLVFENGLLSTAASTYNSKTSGALIRATEEGRFNGDLGQILDLAAPHGAGASRIVVVGGGDHSRFSARAAETFGAEAFRAVQVSGANVLDLMFADLDADLAAQGALGALLASYRFDKYRTTEAVNKTPSITTTRVFCEDPAAAKNAFEPLGGLADGVFFARDLVTEPANILYPEEFARRVKELEPLGCTVEVLGEEALRTLGMGSLLAVGQGSTRESQLVVIQWRGAADMQAKPLAFVGKGVCFDSGGLSIKPAGGMELMKVDMGGAGAVAGLMMALARRRAKVNVVGILGLVENMPDGGAQRPGDVVTSMSGQTIEVINTDSEGRLVLADAIYYCQNRFDPACIVDVATLTGAIRVALGQEVAGIFSNDDALAQHLIEAGEVVGEALWRMPLVASYGKRLRSHIADMKNMDGSVGGAIVAALFIQKFVRNVPWAHLDIAATAWRPISSQANTPDGATGYGVRLLDRFISSTYEA